MALRAITVSLRHDTANFIIVDCSDKSPAINKALNSFVKNHSRYPYLKIKFFCLHGQILNLSNDYCKYADPNLGKRHKIQHILKYVPHPSIVHIVTTKTFFLPNKSAKKSISYRKCLFGQHSLNSMEELSIFGNVIGSTKI